MPLLTTEHSPKAESLSPFSHQRTILSTISLWTDCQAHSLRHHNINDKLYKLGYNLLMSAFDEDNPDLGLLNALQLIQQYFQIMALCLELIN